MFKDMDIGTLWIEKVGPKRTVFRVVTQSFSSDEPSVGLKPNAEPQNDKVPIERAVTWVRRNMEPVIS
ncbi:MULTISPECIES: hypothetical protein [Pseudomonas]|uniref:hypothetical protein n=1 Tax=Pseudomonas TaxID=286 RepID=UPI00117BDD59|nr:MULTISPECIES: hypothetical protein [Pseudomonas]